MSGGVADGFRERVLVQRSQHDAVDFLRDECLDEVDLPIAVVLALGAFPKDIDRCAFGGQLLLRFDRPGMDRFPILMGGAFGNDGDLQRCRAACRRCRAAGTGRYRLSVAPAVMAAGQGGGQPQQCGGCAQFGVLDAHVSLSFDTIGTALKMVAAVIIAICGFGVNLSGE